MVEGYFNISKEDKDMAGQETLTKVEALRAAYAWGNDLIKEMKGMGREVPPEVYEKQLELAGNIIKELEA